MSKTFWAESLDGKLSLGSDYNRARFSEFLKKNPKIRLKIEPQTPESRHQRNFFEGAVIPLIVYYQEGWDYKDSNDCKAMREVLKNELWSEYRIIGGKSVKVGKSTKGELNRGFLDAVLDWMTDQGYQTDVLVPKDYKKWKNEVYPFGGPDNYIDYLVSINKLRPREDFT